MNILRYIAERATEASTWRGLFMVAAAIGVNIAPDLQTAIITTGMGAAGIVGVLTKDK